MMCAWSLGFQIGRGNHGNRGRAICHRRMPYSPLRVRKSICFHYGVVQAEHQMERLLDSASD